jgi:hypothetical protein
MADGNETKLARCYLDLGVRFSRVLERQRAVERMLADLEGRKTHDTSKAKEQKIQTDVNKLAREIVAKGEANVAGFGQSGNYNLQWSAVANMTDEDFDLICDAVSDDWRENEKKAEALYKEKTPLIADYDDRRNNSLV